MDETRQQKNNYTFFGCFKLTSIRLKDDIKEMFGGHSMTIILPMIILNDTKENPNRMKKPLRKIVSIVSQFHLLIFKN